MEVGPTPAVAISANKGDVLRIGAWMGDANGMEPMVPTETEGGMVKFGATLLWAPFVPILITGDVEMAGPVRVRITPNTNRGKKRSPEKPEKGNVTVVPAEANRETPSMRKTDSPDIMGSPPQVHDP